MKNRNKKHKNSKYKISWGTNHELAPLADGYQSVDHHLANN
jgi:hypothetical protein